MEISEKQYKEIEFWRISPTEGPSQFTIENMVNKMSEARCLIDKLRKYKNIFDNKYKVLELGGGKGGLVVF